MRDSCLKPAGCLCWGAGQASAALRGACHLDLQRIGEVPDGRPGGPAAWLAGAALSAGWAAQRCCRGPMRTPAPGKRAGRCAPPAWLRPCPCLLSLAWLCSCGDSPCVVAQGGKRARLRDMGLWVDGPEYYAVPSFVTVDLDNLQVGLPACLPACLLLPPLLLLLLPACVPACLQKEVPACLPACLMELGPRGRSAARLLSTAARLLPSAASRWHVCCAPHHRTTHETTRRTPSRPARVLRPCCTAAA